MNPKQTQENNGEINHSLFSFKKTILVVDDEEINRSILSMMLENDFHIIEAKDGKEALDILLSGHNKIDLVLLDVFMPYDGRDVLRERQQNSQLKNIPFIVCTSDKKIEAECFKLGVNDFVKKPYENPEIIIARINRMIELYEDRSILKEVEREKLTNLYNTEFFIKYSKEFDDIYQEMPKDMMSIVVNRFGLINELYGKEFGNEVLLTITEFLNNYVDNNYGLVGKNDESTFLMYCEHKNDYTNFAEELNNSLQHMKNDIGVSTRISIYPNVDPKLNKEIVIDRTKNSISAFSKDPTKKIAIYNEDAQADTLHKEELVNAFTKALEDEEFKLYFQPKYNIQGEATEFTSAEVLVRWISPKFGFVSPGDFIPLFEEHGLIAKLDAYILKKAAEYIAKWHKQYGTYIHLSVNLSRVDIYRPGLVEDIIEYVDSNNVPHDCYYLEITESAFVEDAKEVIPFISTIRNNGFTIEIDDFGSGYSSFGALADLPFDVLKIDMQFIRTMEKNPKVKDIIKMIINLSKMMNALTVAEGVETEEQFLFLKENGCDVIQGYYLSKPLALLDFEKLIEKEVINNGR